MRIEYNGKTYEVKQELNGSPCKLCDFHDDCIRMRGTFATKHPCSGQMFTAYLKEVKE